MSTLAQTCAALAAFVGAVGLFRLQVLGQQYAAVKHEFLAWGESLSEMDCQNIPLAESLRIIEAAEKSPASHRRQYVEPTQEAGRRWKAFPARLTTSRRALLIFEAWNLLLIAVSLVGFNYVKAWASSSWTFWGVWLAAIGTVAVTGYSVYAWTRE